MVSAVIIVTGAVYCYYDYYYHMIRCTVIMTNSVIIIIVIIIIIIVDMHYYVYCYYQGVRDRDARGDGTHGPPGRAGRKSLASRRGQDYRGLRRRATLSYICHSLAQVLVISESDF